MNMQHNGEAVAYPSKLPRRLLLHDIVKCRYILISISTYCCIENLSLHVSWKNPNNLPDS